MLKALWRPIRFLLFSPRITLLNLAVAFAFGLSFLLLTTFPVVFQEQYGFSTGTAGLSYLGMGAGMLIAVIIFSSISDQLLAWHQRRGKHEPENRLALMAVFAPTIPVGCFWYGWAVDKGTHWIVPIIGTSFVGVGSMFVMVTSTPSYYLCMSVVIMDLLTAYQMPVQLYLIDALGPEAAASGLASNTILRSIAGALLPLAGRPLYDSLGMGWGNSLLGFLAVLFLPVPWLFYIYGSKLGSGR